MHTYIHAYKTPTCAVGVCAVEPVWLSELAPHFYTFKGDAKKQDASSSTVKAGGAGTVHVHDLLDLAGDDRGGKHPRIF
jgi:hypothetical protein